MRVGGALPSRRAHEKQEEGASRRQEERRQEERTRQDKGNCRPDETKGAERAVHVLRGCKKT